MPKNNDKRERLIKAAAVLVHSSIYSHAEPKIPLGNVYYARSSDDLPPEEKNDNLSSLSSQDHAPAVKRMR